MLLYIIRLAEELLGDKDDAWSCTVRILKKSQSQEGNIANLCYEVLADTSSNRNDIPEIILFSKSELSSF